MQIPYDLYKLAQGLCIELLVHIFYYVEFGYMCHLFCVSQNIHMAP